MRLQGKVAIITGGAHGTGEAERGSSRRRAPTSLSPTSWWPMPRRLPPISAPARRRIAAAIDVTREADWQALIDKTLAALWPARRPVNNAGISGSSVGDPDGLDGLDRVIAVNQTSVFLGTKLAAEQMAKTGGGSSLSSARSWVLSAGRAAIRLTAPRRARCGLHESQRCVMALSASVSTRCIPAICRRC